MGRPLNKKYFANTNYQDFGTANVGGESVGSVANVTGLSGMTYLTGGPYTILAADIGAPQLTGGAKPVLTFQPTSATAGTVTVVSAGSGYTSAPTVTVRGSLAAGSGTATPTVTLTANGTARQNSIKCEAQIGSGGSEVTTGDIIKQVSDIRYKVQTTDGTAVCKLVQTADLGENEMSITATDANSNAYFVRKLTARKAVLTRKVSGNGDFATGASVKWTLGSATSDTVSIENQ
jgi:hypothetical protein